MTCLNCPLGFGGDLCDMCVDNYYGDVADGDNCTLCNCSGNVDPYAVDTVTRKSSVITNLYQTQYSNTHKKSVTMRRFYVDVMIIIL